MPKILVVEDDKSIVTNLTEYLCNEGFEIDSVNGQADAIEKISLTKYDLVLLDISYVTAMALPLCGS